MNFNLTMKTPYLIFLLSSSLILFTSCRQQKTETREAVQTEQPTDEPYSLLAFKYTDSLMLGSHKIVYTIDSRPDDELPVVVDEDGAKYKDNRFTLVIIKDGAKFFNRSFTKADFKSQLGEDFQKYGIMDGMRFNHAKEGKLYFNTCVSFPESDMSCPFFLIVGPDGSYSIAPDTTPDDNLPPEPDDASV